MRNEFVPCAEALALKELGFDYCCFCSYSPEGELARSYGTYYKIHPSEVTIAPLYQQAFKWFREKYNLRGFIGFRPNIKKFDCHVYDMSLSGKEYVEQRTMKEFNKDPLVGSYEEAELACLRKLIEIAKQNKHE